MPNTPLSYSRTGKARGGSEGWFTTTYPVSGSGGSGNLKVPREHVWVCTCRPLFTLKVIFVLLTKIEKCHREQGSEGEFIRIIRVKMAEGGLPQIIA